VNFAPTRFCVSSEAISPYFFEAQHHLQGLLGQREMT